MGCIRTPVGENCGTVSTEEKEGYWRCRIKIRDANRDANKRKLRKPETAKRTEGAKRQENAIVRWARDV